VAEPLRNRRVLVTGAAGFIGSRLCRELVTAGVSVVGVDNFDPYYGRTQKERNLKNIEGAFELLELDLAEADLAPVVAGVDEVFHVAAQAGVRGSWAEGFGDYVTNNVLVTQRLLEASRPAGLKRFVYSCSSSVYGDVNGPVGEEAPTRPRSPYGATKLAGEHLCGVYAREFGVPTVSLRYFTVFGPGQRPDMAIHRMIECALTGTEFRLFGDGTASRDFTFVDDVVAANLCAASNPADPGEVFNVGGGGSRTINQVLDDVGVAVGQPVPVVREERQAGDVKITASITERARQRLHWSPATSWSQALERQVAWHRANRDVLEARRAGALSGASGPLRD